MYYYNQLINFKTNKTNKTNKYEKLQSKRW